MWISSTEEPWRRSVRATGFPLLVHATASIRNRVFPIVGLISQSRVCRYRRIRHRSAPREPAVEHEAAKAPSAQPDRASGGRLSGGPSVAVAGGEPTDWKAAVGLATSHSDPQPRSIRCAASDAAGSAGISHLSNEVQYALSMVSRLFENLADAPSAELRR